MLEERRRQVETLQAQIQRLQEEARRNSQIEDAIRLDEREKEQARRVAQDIDRRKEKSEAYKGKGKEKARADSDGGEGFSDEDEDDEEAEVDGYIFGEADGGTDDEMGDPGVCIIPAHIVIANSFVMMCY